jgi:DNA-binding HxlR family transcriptional regulator
LRDLTLFGKTRYQEFLKSNEGIATNILAERLARLERNGLISKAVDPDDKRQIIYAPTRKALHFVPVIREMARWGKRYGQRAVQAAKKPDMVAHSIRSAHRSV